MLGALTGLKGRRETLDIYLVNKDKLMISESRFFGKEVFLKHLADTEPVRECLSGGKEIKGKWLDYRDIRVFGASMCIPGYNWTLIVEIDEQEVLQKVNKLKQTLLVVSILLIFFIIILGIYFSRRLINPINKLFAATEKIRAGDYDASVPVYSQDEVGQLAQGFNLMISAIVESKNSIEKYISKLKKQNKQVKDQQKTIWARPADASGSAGKGRIHLSWPCSPPLEHCPGILSVVEE